MGPELLDDACPGAGGESSQLLSVDGDSSSFGFAPDADDAAGVRCCLCAGETTDDCSVGVLKRTRLVAEGDGVRAGSCAGGVLDLVVLELEVDDGVVKPFGTLRDGVPVVGTVGTICGTAAAADWSGGDLERDRSNSRGEPGGVDMSKLSVG